MMVRAAFLRQRMPMTLLEVVALLTLVVTVAYYAFDVAWKISNKDNNKTKK